MNTIDINNIITKRITDEKHIKIYKKYIIPLINDYASKPVCKFISMLFEINPDPYTKSVICYIIEQIYIDIYNAVGYQKYSNFVFIKQL